MDPFTLNVTSAEQDFYGDALILLSGADQAGREHAAQARAARPAADGQKRPAGRARRGGIPGARVLPVQPEFPVFFEVQLRTLAMDCWASIEHQLKYKQEVPDQRLIVQELKKCADEITSTDLSLETIRNLIEALR